MALEARYQLGETVKSFSDSLASFLLCSRVRRLVSAEITRKKERKKHMGPAEQRNLKKGSKRTWEDRGPGDVKNWGKMKSRGGRRHQDVEIFHVIDNGMGFIVHLFT